MSVKAHILGFPRIGTKRELKFAVEKFWRGEITQTELEIVAKTLKQQNWDHQKEANLDYITVGDFAYYDHVLNTTVLLGAIPTRFGIESKALNLETYFTLARGNAAHPALEMTKWFDTNYHYLVPELTSDLSFSLHPEWLFADIDAAQKLGLPVKVVLLSPLSYLYLAKSKNENGDKLAFLSQLLPLYTTLLEALQKRGVACVQLDEPILSLELESEWIKALDVVYATLAETKLPVLLTTYFESVANYAPLLKTLPVTGIHLDLVRAPEQHRAFLTNYAEEKILSLGVIDGRNIWRNDLSITFDFIQQLQKQVKNPIWIAPSCSLLHTPVDLNVEQKIEPVTLQSLAFSVQKLDELAILKRGCQAGKEAIAHELSQSDVIQNQKRALRAAAREARQVNARLEKTTIADFSRQSDFAHRQAEQHAHFALPLLPTTTIGSFPQTTEIRQLRARFKAGELSQDGYETGLKKEIEYAIRVQEEIGLDVLVHGEAERNDMVEYFGEQLDGFIFTQNGWVQSYGSRCVKPPIIFSDVARPHAMTVEWSKFAQSLTNKPVKGMLTGPVTILQWSFVREDQPRQETALQIALAIRDEVSDLEAAHIEMIQIDEPAFREGLPLKKSEWNAYLTWAVNAFKLATSSVKNSTQIHTHMCYSEFNDILPAIAALDADVITIETSRSDMELLTAFSHFRYPNEIGPGVYDIHSPRVPAVTEMVHLIQKAIEVIPVRHLWINPDCGLKTRGWSETKAALINMLEATKNIRQKIEI